MPILNVRWPREYAPETCRFGRARNDIAQESPRTRNRKIIRQGRPLWSAELSWTLPNNSSLAALRYWLEGLDGFNGSVQIWDFASPRPEHSPSPAHWAEGVVLTLGTAALANATSIALTGLTPSTIAALQGQYVQIGRRLYLVAADVTASGGGAATINIVTPLIAAAPIGTEVRFSEAACDMELISQEFSGSARAGDGFVSVSANFRETVVDKS